jgi:hypothetical protein
MIVRLDEAVQPLTSDLRDLGQTWRYRVGPALLDHSDPAFVELSATVGPDALRPLSPLSVAAMRIGGAVTISWLRRTRVDGDAWEPVEIPLGESVERYEIAIMRGTSVIRTFTTAEPMATYPAAQELSDFGAPQSRLDLRVTQMSSVVGRGFETVSTVTVVPGAT